MFSGPIFMAACGGGLSVGGTSSKSGNGGSSDGSINVSALPSNATLVSGGTQQFTAVVSHSANTGVTWSATAGTVDSAGLFTAPSVSSARQINVKATSQADATKSATVSLVVNPIVTTPGTPVPHSVFLSWKSSTDPKTVSYSVYRSTVLGGSYGLLASAIGTAAYSDQSVQSGTTYYYVVTAVDDAGQESAYSNGTRATIP
ncbi:MAG: hypothetical protein WA637_16370 [Terriglobales bacterium]